MKHLNRILIVTVLLTALVPAGAMAVLLGDLHAAVKTSERVRTAMVPARPVVPANDRLGAFVREAYVRQVAVGLGPAWGSSMQLFLRDQALIRAQRQLMGAVVLARSNALLQARK